MRGVPRLRAGHRGISAGEDAWPEGFKRPLFRCHVLWQHRHYHVSVVLAFVSCVTFLDRSRSASQRSTELFRGFACAYCQPGLFPPRLLHLQWAAGEPKFWLEPVWPMRPLLTSRAYTAWGRAPEKLNSEGTGPESKGSSSRFLHSLERLGSPCRTQLRPVPRMKPESPFPEAHTSSKSTGVPSQPGASCGPWPADCGVDCEHSAGRPRCRAAA